MSCFAFFLDKFSKTWRVFYLISSPNFNQKYWSLFRLCKIYDWKSSFTYLSRSKQIYAFQYLKVKVAQSCPALRNPVDHTVREFLQARLLEWVAFPFCRGSSQPGNQIQVSCIADGFLTNWAIREALQYLNLTPEKWISFSIYIQTDKTVTFF